MPYGKGGRLGEGIDPRLMQVDYSGYADVGRTQGQAFANMGAQIGDVIKQRGEQEKFIKKSEQLAKSIGELIPELKPQADDALAALASPDLSRRDRLAVAESITGTLQIGMMGLENQRANAALNLRRAAMMAKAEPVKLPISPAQVRAAYAQADAGGFGEPVRALVREYETAKTPEDEQKIAEMIMNFSAEVLPSKFKGETEEKTKQTALDQRYEYLRSAYMLKTGKTELTADEEASLKEQAVRLDPMDVMIQRAMSGLEDDL